MVFKVNCFIFWPVGGGGPKKGFLVFYLRRLRLVKAVSLSRGFAHRELGIEMGLGQDH